MNFFWKVFFSTILIAAATFSIGSFYLIDLQFRTTLGREIVAAFEENDILYYALDREFKTMKINSVDRDANYKVIEYREQFISKIAQSVTINTSKGTIPFRLSDSKYETVFSSADFSVGNQMLKELSVNKKGYEIIHSGSRYLIHAAGPIAVLNEVMYLENYRDITFLFQNRSEQYHSFYYLMLAMISVSGAVIFVISRWLTKPLKTLSQATKQIAGGNFERRVAVQSRDEIGKLSRDFNKMAAKIEQMVEELKESSRRQEDFVASFAHELKTPLTSIIGYADMLRSKRMDQEQIILSANYIFEEGKRLESLSMKLMEMIVLKTQDFKMKRVNAADFLEDIHGILQPVMNRENIELVTSCEDAVLFIEHDLMKTVCMNLLDNARKSMEGGGRIIFSGQWEDDRYILSVQDTGKGMEQAELSKITEAFYMVDKSRARAQGGAGLGLAICSAIVKLHGAEMEFESSPGNGTRVTIYLKGAAKP